MKINKLLALTLCAMLMTAPLTACGGSDNSSDAPVGSNDTTSEAPDSSEAAESEYEPDPSLPEWYDEMNKRSMVSYGDTTIMHEKIKKAQSGEKVTIAYLGGSITEGASAGAEDCYAKLSYNYFKEKFGTGDNVEYVNAGLSGTPSLLGNLRLYRDILSKEPDICFIEFAVNDSRDSAHKAAYESIVRDLIEHDVAVVLLFARMDSGYSAQDIMKPTGEYYSLPMISYADGISYVFDNGFMTWSDFSGDYTHPNNEGHAMVAEIIDYYFDTVGSVTEEKAEYPSEPLNKNIQQGMQMLQSKDIEPDNFGSWKTGSNVASFRSGWTYYPTQAGNEPLIFTVKGKALHLVYKEVKTNNYGKIKIKVKSSAGDEIEKTIDPVSKNGWGNPRTVQLASNDEEVEYEIQIRMADGDEEKEAQILALAHN